MVKKKRMDADFELNVNIRFIGIKKDSAREELNAYRDALHTILKMQSATDVEITTKEN